MTHVVSAHQRMLGCQAKQTALDGGTKYKEAPRTFSLFHIESVGLYCSLSYRGVSDNCNEQSNTELKIDTATRKFVKIAFPDYNQAVWETKELKVWRKTCDGSGKWKVNGSQFNENFYKSSLFFHLMRGNGCVNLLLDQERLSIPSTEVRVCFNAHFAIDHEKERPCHMAWRYLLAVKTMAFLSALFLFELSFVFSSFHQDELLRA